MPESEAVQVLGHEKLSMSYTVYSLGLTVIELKEIVEKIKRGFAFENLAKTHSDGPSKTRGGDLGSFGKGMMHKAFEDACWKLKINSISWVVETPFGYHIIKRTK